MLRVIELFGGIGACSKALENLGVEFEVADYVEIDKYAVKSFNAVHGTNFEPQDITKWDKDIECDLIMHGSPCQDFSIAGRQAGGDEDSGTRSSLMYETLRIVEKLKPKYVIWENVKNIISKKHIHNWEAYCNRMNELGYCNWCKVMNAKDYGIPQNRERVFTISIRKDVSDKEFLFPEPVPLERRLKDMLEDDVDGKFYLDGKYEGLRKINENYVQMVGGKIGRMHDISRRAYSPYYLSPTIPTCSGGNIQPKVIEPFVVASRGRGENNEQHLEPRFDGTTNTLTSVQKDNYVATPYRIRKLTPKECWRLMGFDDSDFEKAEKVNSNTQLYKQAGNSIVVDVIQSILNKLIVERSNSYGK